MNPKEKIIPTPESSPITPEQQEYEKILNGVESNPRLHTLLSDIPESIQDILRGEKGELLRKLLSDPSIYTVNPAQYTELMNLIGMPREWVGEFQRGVTDAQKMEWMQKSPEKLMAYMSWEEGQTSKKLAANQNIGTETITENNKKKELIDQITPVNKKLSELLSPGEQAERDQFIESELEKQQRGESNYLTRDFGSEATNRVYLESVFYLNHASQIRARIVEEYSSAPEKQSELDAKLKVFDTSIDALRQSSVTRDITPEWKSAITKSFAPTLSRETAIAQVEKYVTKDTSILRSGNSIYIIDPKNPDTVRKLDIHAQETTLTVIHNKLSLTLPLENLSSKEVAERRKKEEKGRIIQKVEGDSTKALEEYTTIRNEEKGLEDNLYEEEIVSTYPEASTEYARLETELLGGKLTLEDKKKTIDLMYEQSKSLKKGVEGKMGQDAQNGGGKLEKYGKVNDILSRRIESLRKLTLKVDEEIKYKSEKNTREETPENKYKVWEEKAYLILKRVTNDTMGYGELGEDRFNQLIEALKIKNPNGIWSEGKLSTSDNTRLKQQIDDLEDIINRKVSKYSSTGEPKVAWQNIKNEISTSESELYKIWKNPEKLGSWLTEDGVNK